MRKLLTYMNVYFFLILPPQPGLCGQFVVVALILLGTGVTGRNLDRSTAIDLPQRVREIRNTAADIRGRVESLGDTAVSVINPPCKTNFCADNY